MDRLKTHKGDHKSIHQQCLNACRKLINQKQHIDIALGNISAQAKKDYRIRLNATVSCARYLLLQGQPFRGHDESEESLNRGNFLTLLKMYTKPNEEMKKVVLNNAPENNKMIAPSIQKDVANACSFLTTRKIIEDIGDDYFSLLVDEARDVSIKEQMAIVLRYVDKRGCIVERFIGVVHVTETTARSLKSGIEDIFATHGLSMSHLRGQGYDGASNMRGEFNGLKSLILAENKCAFYVHCFAHQLQLALVKVAKNHKILRNFFEYLNSLSNIIGSSCKRRELLRGLELERIVEGIACGDLETGRGLNQETTLKRPGDTRWGSHYGTILSVIHLFSSTVKLLNVIEDHPSFESSSSTEAHGLLINIETFEFAFLLFLMRNVLGISFELSQALQRKDQDLINAMVLVKVAKERLQIMRETGWDDLITENFEFCNKHDINLPNMEDLYAPLGRSRRGLESITNLFHFKVDIFYTVINSQLQELNDRFDNVNTKLIESVACLDPRNFFSAFDKNKLIEFAKLYPSDFSDTDLSALDNQLQTYIIDMRMNAEFCNLKGVSELAQKMVEKQKHISYSLVYLLVKLALILTVATATVERVFSAMNLLKTPLRNRIGDIWLNDTMVTFIEREVFESIEDEAIMQQFQKMKPRRAYL